MPLLRRVFPFSPPRTWRQETWKQADQYQSNGVEVNYSILFSFGYFSIGKPKENWRVFPLSKFILYETKKLRFRGAEAKLKIPSSFADNSRRSRSQIANHRQRRLRSCCGLGMLPLLFLLAVAMKENKANREQSKHKGVFLRFGDDLVVDDNPHLAGGARKARGQSLVVVEGSRKEVADGLGDDARPRPRRRSAGGIGEIASRNANPHVIFVTGILVQPKAGNGSAAATAAAEGHRGRVGGAGGKDVGGAAAGNPVSNGMDVCWIVRARKQGRKSEGLLVGFVGVEKVAANFPRVSTAVTAGGADAP